MNYVAGFMFDKELKKVALIRKNKPDWQKGKLNGVGGAIEKFDKTASHAMIREFEEETSVITTLINWRQFLVMKGKNDDNKEFRVDFFVSTGDLSLLKSPTDEKIEIIDLAEIHCLREDVVENLTWLVSLGLDFIKDKRPSFTEVYY